MIGIDSLGERVVKELHEFFSIKRESRTDEDLKSARLAQATLGACAKLKQHESAIAAVNFAMARQLAEDKEELAKYVRLSLPRHPITLALAKPKKK